ncbi:hypothetical protein HQQ81_16925 [Microbacteriaceae bacterium VKM Ac-2854]|nr:hypothetical protein [Microbacteriaceae bacterium VKM Ac-2854]
MLAVRPHLDAAVICFSSLPEPAQLPADTVWVLLPRDDTREGEREPEDPTADGLLHWAPLGHLGHRARLAAIAAVSAERQLAALVVDVSVEVVLFARLLGVPVVVVTQPGARDDEPHALAYRAATRIVAPWPSESMQPRHLRSRAEAVVYTGGISRFDGREPHERGRGVVLLAGQGGSNVSDAEVAAAAAATGEPWMLLGRGAWREDPWPAIAAADLVVTWAGQNAVADIAAAGAHAVVIPQERPFDEQRATAAALDRAGLAVVEPVWPAAERWPAVLERARALRPMWQRWGTAGAAQRAAAAIAGVLR